MLLSDDAILEELTDQIDADWVRATFSDRDKHGWQRRLAQRLGVAESTISGWLKNDKFPEWACRSIAILHLRDLLPQEPPKYRPVKTDEGYAIYSFEGEVGVLKADNIPSLEDALLFAAAPALREVAGDAWVILDDADMDGGLDAIRRLDEALKLAKPPEINEATVSPDVVEAK